MKFWTRNLFNAENLSFAGNTASLAMIKGADMVTQLLVMPRLISKLGMESYGQIAFFVVIMQYITFVCDFGYNFNATKRVSENKDSKNISAVFSAVTPAKVLIMAVLLCLIMLAGFIFSEALTIEVSLSLAVFTFFSALTLDWLYLGLQKMIVPATIKIAYRIFYVFYIYIFINEGSSYTSVVILDALCPVVLTSFSLVYAFIFLKIRFVKINKDLSLTLFKESWILFSSSVFITFYRNINVIILKLISGEFYAGVYAAAEKIVRALQAVVEPISTALFPYVGRKFAVLQSNKEKLSFINKLLILYLPSLSLMSLLIWIFTPQVLFYMKVDTPNADLNLHIMILAFFSGCLNYLLGYVGLVNFGKNKDFRYSVTVVGCVSLILSPILVCYLKDIGAAISLALSETLLLVLLVLRFKTIKVNLL